jgi:plastocyanin
MPLNTLNSVGGFSVGESEAEVISANGNISTGNLTVNTAGVVNFTTTSNVALGNVSNLHISGGTANYVLSTDGAGNLSWVAGGGGGAISNISNGNSNVSIPVANGNVNISAVGNANVVVITGTGANITGTANITGNLTAGNIIAGSGSGGNITNANVISANTFTATGNVTSGNLTTAGVLSVTGNANVGNIGAAAGVFTTVAGTLTTAAQGNITSVGTLTSLVVTGNISSGNANLGNAATANYFIGNGSVLSALTFGNITTFSTAGLTTDELYLQATTRLNVTASGSSGYLFDQYGATLNPALYVTSGQTLAFNLNVTGHPFLIQTSGGANYSVGLEHVDTSGTVLTTTSAQGQVSGTLYWKVPYGITGNYKYQCSIHGGMNGNIVVTDANVSNITVGLATYATTANSVAGANVSGQVSNATVAGTVYTNAQPNITSVGNLSGLSVSNATGVVDFTTTANVTLGAVANLHIAGGSNGQYLQTNGSGTLTWSTVTSGSTSNISNGNSNISIPVANGNINFTAAGNANIVVVTGTGVNVAGTLNVTGQSNLGAVGNVVITGGTANYVLSTDGAGNLSWVAGGGSAANVIVDNFTGNGVQTVFTLSTTPIGINQTSVNYNGATILRTDYSLANANITFSSAPANGSLIEVTTIDLSGGGGGTPGGTNTQVQFNDAGSFAGNAGLTFNKTTTTLTANNFVATSTANLGSNANVIITGGTANYVLSTNGSGNLSWVAQSGGGGSANIAIYDEGNLLTSTVSSLDFVGSGVTATNIGNAVTVTITGGGGGGPASIILDSFTGNGVQTAFALSTAPASENYTFVNIDGVDQLKTAYSVAGSTLTFSSAPINGAQIEVTIVSALSNAQPNFTTRTYTGNGVQNTFAVTNGVTSTGILVTENGILQTPDTDYSVTGANLIFTTAPANLQAIQVRELGTVVAEIANFANIANTANSVAVANVSGIGNIATTNYNGNGSQVLAGNGAWVNSSSGTSSARALGYSLIFGG